MRVVVDLSRFVQPVLKALKVMEDVEEGRGTDGIGHGQRLDPQDHPPQDQQP